MLDRIVVASAPFMKSGIGIAMCLPSAAFLAGGQDSGQASDHTRREWQGIVEDMASRGATAAPDELREIAGWPSRRCGNVRINQWSARDLEQKMELPHADAETIVAYRTKNGRIENFDALKKTGIDPSKLEPYKESIFY